MQNLLTESHFNQSWMFGFRILRITQQNGQLKLLDECQNCDKKFEQSTSRLQHFPS